MFGGRMHARRNDFLGDPHEDIGAVPPFTLVARSCR